MISLTNLFCEHRVEMLQVMAARLNGTLQYILRADTLSSSPSITTTERSSLGHGPRPRGEGIAGIRRVESGDRISQSKQKACMDRIPHHPPKKNNRNTFITSDRLA